jgi:hypothetical protein
MLLLLLISGNEFQQLENILSISAIFLGEKSYLISRQIICFSLSNLTDRLPLEIPHPDLPFSLLREESLLLSFLQNLSASVSAKHNTVGVLQIMNGCQYVL